MTKFNGVTLISTLGTLVIAGISAVGGAWLTLNTDYLKKSSTDCNLVAVKIGVLSRAPATQLPELHAQVLQQKAALPPQSTAVLVVDTKFQPRFNLGPRDMPDKKGWTNSEMEAIAGEVTEACQKDFRSLASLLRSFHLF